MNQWITYSKETRKQIVGAKAIAIKHNSGSTKTVTNAADMMHYVKYDCSCLIHQFKVL